jgi:flagellar basal body rod protein FlgB
MSNPWFRVYSEFATDPKVQMLAEAMQRRLIMILCLRCSNTLVTLHDSEIAFHLRISDQELAETKALFVSKKFIDKDWNVLNWEKRQFKSDSSKDRVAKHRALQKTEQEGQSNDDVTLQVTNANALEQNRYRTEQIQNRDSVAKATDGNAVEKSPEQMSKDELWVAGKSLLEASGMPAKQCGTAVGKLCKDFGSEVVVEAVRSAVVARPVDPMAYLKAACQRAAGQRAPPNKQAQIERENEKVMTEWLAKQGAEIETA